MLTISEAVLAEHRQDHEMAVSNIDYGRDLLTKERPIPDVIWEVIDALIYRMVLRHPTQRW